MNAIDIAKSWLKYAKSDLLTAKHMFENVYPLEIEIVCYHSHQCAEKAMKSYCIFNNLEPPKTHDLISLCNLCISFEDSFSAMMNNCSKLNPYGVSVRYPNELELDETIANLALTMAKETFEFCYSKIYYES